MSENTMNVKVSRKILGVFAIIIMLHHLSQKTSAFWVPAAYKQHGLEPFVPVGYLMVAFFFFCSGYGLIKSLRAKKNYVDDFLVKRFNKIVPAFLIMQLAWLIVRALKKSVEFPLNPYSWFIYTILILYIGFYVAYKRECKASIFVMGAWILAYSVICYALVKGNWWINASPVFLLGIIMADKKEEKRSIPAIVISAVICTATFFASENADKIYHMAGMSNYGVLNVAKIVVQIIAASAFSLFVYNLAIGPVKGKESLPGKVLAFFGKMTLEFYLVHGLFVEIFAHHFTDDSTKAICYIKNIFLYVIVVFALSTAAAYALRRSADLIEWIYDRFNVLQKLSHDIKRIIIALLILAVVVVGFMTIRQRVSVSNAAADLEKYRNENITMVDVGGTDIAVYQAGEGDYTMVLMSSYLLPGSTMHLKPLADKLSENYRVVVIDYPGTGFSGDSDGERTVDFYADVIKGTLDGLEIKENIVLMPHFMSGPYAYRFIEKYPEGVAAMISLDAFVPELAPHIASGNYSSEDECRWAIGRYARYSGMKQKVMSFTGFVNTQMPIYENFYAGKYKENIPAMKALFSRDYMQGACIEEYSMIYDNLNAEKGFKMPSDIPARFLQSYYIYEVKMFGVNWGNAYKNMITNEETQTVQNIAGDPYMFYYKPDTMKKAVDEFMEAI